MRCTKSFKKRLSINKSAIFKLAYRFTAFIFTIWSFVSLFVSFSDCFSTTSDLYKIIAGILVLFAIFIGSTIVATVEVVYTNRVCIGESTTKNFVYVQYGNMFSPDVVKKDYNGKQSIVISVNRCFDTIVDNQLISLKTQHGQAFQHLYREKRYTPDSLNEAIFQSISNNISYQQLTRKEKPSGNLKRYDVGTIALLEIDNNASYYLLGLSWFDSNLNAQTSIADFVIAVQKLIEFCNQKAQGYPVVLPLLGSGLSRTKIELSNILHYLTEAFAINKEKINNDFHIVIWEGDKNKVSIKNLRKWQ